MSVNAYMFRYARYSRGRGVAPFPPTFFIPHLRKRFACNGPTKVYHPCGQRAIKGASTFWERFWECPFKRGKQRKNTCASIIFRPQKMIAAPIFINSINGLQVLELAKCLYVFMVYMWHVCQGGHKYLRSFIRGYQPFHMLVTGMWQLWFVKPLACAWQRAPTSIPPWRYHMYVDGDCMAFVSETVVWSM